MIGENKPIPVKLQEDTVKSVDKEEVTPETWRSVNLEMHKPDGSIAKISLLRPLWWLKDAGAKVGKSIALSIPEMGIEGDAKVLDVSPCKADSRKAKSPRQRLVTGKFVHENAIVWDLTFNNNSDSKLGVTANHPIWSATRNTWGEAGQLKIGELVKTKDGVAQLTMHTQRPGRHKVYNLEVHKTHTYYVSNLAILAHNACAPTSPNQLNKQIKTGAAPKGIKRIDTPKIKGEKLHAHFDDGRALNSDGTWKHGSGTITSKQKKMA